MTVCAESLPSGDLNPQSIEQHPSEGCTTGVRIRITIIRVQFFPDLFSSSGTGMSGYPLGKVHLPLNI